MAQGGVDERLGDGGIQQPATLAACAPSGGLGVGFRRSSLAGSRRRAAGTMVPGLLSLFGKVRICHQPVGGANRAGALFFHHRHAAWAGPAVAGQRPIASAPPGGSGELLDGSPEKILARPDVLAAAYAESSRELKGGHRSPR
jgi:hypothetical protein